MLNWAASIRKAFQLPAAGMVELFNPAKIINLAGVSAPSLSIVTVPENPVSCYQLRHVLTLFSDTRGACALRSGWDEALESVVAQGEVNFADISGCLSSKSGLTSFEHMRRHPAAAANVGYHIEAYRGRADILADKVLNGTFDYAVQKDQPAAIVRQDWDGKMWIANTGGSHRSAAVWHLDREVGQPRILPASVVTYRLTPGFRETCETHSIWIFSAPDGAALREARGAFSTTGMVLSPQNRSAAEPLSTNWCLGLPKHHPLEREVARLMSEAFSLSDWVTEAYAAQPRDIRLVLNDACNIAPGATKPGSGSF